MSCRPSRRAATLVLVTTAAALASCSSAVPVDGVAVGGEVRIPTGVTTQLDAIASVARGRLVHDVTDSAAWTSSDPSVATVSGGLVRGVRAGGVTITATAGGASGTLDLTVTDAKLVGIDLGPALTLPAGVKRQLTATGSYSDLTTRDLTSALTWTTSAPTVATVSDAPGSLGLVASAGPGTATIAAVDPASGVAAQLVVTVSAAQLVSLAMTPAAPSVPLGTAQQFTVVGTYTDATTQDLTQTSSWSSSAGNVASVSTSGTARGRATTSATGTATITATDPASHLSASAVLTVTAARLTSLAVTPSAPSLALGTKQQLTATGTYTDATTRDLTATVAWQSSDGAIAQVSGTAGTAGLLSAVGVGSASVKATEASSGVSTSVPVTVTAAQLVSIAVTPASPSVPVGLTRQLTATGTYTDGTTHDLTATVTWASATPAAATISNAAASGGLATAIAVGSTVISATDPASHVAGLTTLTVTAAQLASISVTPTTPSTPLGTTTRFTATGIYTDATTHDLTATATWSASNASVASVSNAAGTSGVATTLATGSTTITATDPATHLAGSTTLTVTAARLVSVAVTPAASSVPSGLAVRFSAVGTYTDGSTQVLTSTVTWSSSTAAIAAVSNAAGSQGEATTGALGTTTVTALDPATQLSGSTTLTVTAAELASIAVTPPSPSVPLGLPRQFTATGTYTNGTTQDLTAVVTWTSSAGAVATVSNAAPTNGLATTAAAGATTVTAADPTTHVSGSTTLTVTAAQLASLAIAPATASLAVGATQQFTATGTYTDATTQDLTGVVAWSTAAPAVAGISSAVGSQGLATAVAAGQTTVTATAPGTSPPVTATAALTVTP